MNDREKLEYLEKYQLDKERGEPFFPDAIFKDSVVALLIFLGLFGLTAFVGTELSPIADPTDTTYTPRPEWYFLFLFQLLKYFPGSIEVIGVIVLPVLAIVFLALLPWTDRSRFRHWSNRPVVTGITLFLLAGGVWLTVQSMIETPPPAEAAEQGDTTAALYAANCAACHGLRIDVSPGADLAGIIAAGNHEGMPGWGADFSASEIDGLVGFILAPSGAAIFAETCGECHQTSDLVVVEPVDLRAALAQGPNYPAHADVDVPIWSEVIDQAAQTELLNYLTAPDGRRLYTRECSSCHGRLLAFDGTEAELRAIIAEGGLHLDMPAFGGQLPQSSVETLAAYVINPGGVPEGPALFAQNCAACHHDLIPRADSFSGAVATITSGMAHQTMPVWGQVLTNEQIDALVEFIVEQAAGSPLVRGEELYAQNCATCHGALGEGGPNPARPDDIIAPISTAEYLETRDDATLRAIIAQGQPNFGMSPFGNRFGGPLNSEDVDALVAFMRAWQADPPVDLPPGVTPGVGGALHGDTLFDGLCAQCHAVDGTGVAGLGPSLVGEDVQSRTDQQLFNDINLGHQATTMIAWGEVLSSAQIQEIVRHIRAVAGTGASTVANPTFEVDVRKIFAAKCDSCHGTLGGWDGTAYRSAIESGDNGPAVIPGDAEASFLAQKVLGTHTIGGIMPPGGKLPDREIQVIVDWIDQGAPER